MLNRLASSNGTALYRYGESGGFESWIATTPQTRGICNDPRIAGVRYTASLQEACANVLRLAPLSLEENSAVLVNILRGGLNFGLRDALHEAFSWNNHTTCFISAQRARGGADPEEWHITENAYRKLYFPREASFLIGDVVATGTSLRYALTELIAAAQQSGTQLRNIVFFTIGGPKAIEILRAVDEQCRAFFPSYQQTRLIFFEGCFTVPDTTTPLTIRLTGTDLVRLNAVMAPEFIESQYEDPSYPLERCVIYDAGSRAFWVREYAADVTSYWQQVLNLAGRHVTFASYLKERFPEMDASRFGDVPLDSLALRQIERVKPMIH